MFQENLVTVMAGALGIVNNKMINAPRAPPGWECVLSFNLERFVVWGFFLKREAKFSVK